MKVGIIIVIVLSIIAVSCQARNPMQSDKSRQTSETRNYNATTYNTTACGKRLANLQPGTESKWCGICTDDSDCVYCTSSQLCVPGSFWKGPKEHGESPPGCSQWYASQCSLSGTNFIIIVSSVGGFVILVVICLVVWCIFSRHCRKRFFRCLCCKCCTRKVKLEYIPITSDFTDEPRPLTAHQERADAMRSKWGLPSS